MNDSQEALRELVQMVDERGNSPEQIATNVLKLNRIRDIVMEAVPGCVCAQTAHKPAPGKQR